MEGNRRLMAEGVGFEPTDGCPSLVFKTSAFNRSATLPATVFKAGTFNRSASHPRLRQVGTAAQAEDRRFATLLRP
jgi:hypothetical protein